MKDKKFITLVIIIILIICGLFYYLFTMNNNMDVEINTGENQGESLPKESPSFYLVNDYDEFFKVNSLINKYYANISVFDRETLFDLINPDYIASKMITTENIEDILKPEDVSYAFYLTKVYVRKTGSIKYYFANGKKETYKVLTKETIMEDENLILIHDTKNNTFNVMVQTVENTPLESFAKNYETKDDVMIELNEHNVFYAQTLSSEDKVRYYINFYKKILNLDMQNAYNYLNSSMLKTYDTYEKFTENINDIYDSINGEIRDYSFNNKGRISASFASKKTISFEEKEIMDFKVGIK